MAVYTHLGAEELAELIAEYAVGELVSAKGIAEGVSNSNWLVETTTGRFILTMYEMRVDTADLPFFLGLLDHLSERDCPVPRTIHDRSGAAFRTLKGKAVALIEFLPGVSLDRPTAAQARAVGGALAAMHLAARDFPGRRPNALDPQAWQRLLSQCGEDGLAAIDPQLPGAVDHALPALLRDWPAGLEVGTIHADLFPDNVLMQKDAVTGLIDFYFACTDILAYDLAITHAAWCFEDGGRRYRPAIGAALVEGYEEVRSLTDEERAALPLLAQGAAMRFVATRAYDYLNTPADALVTRKDPMDFVRIMQFYQQQGTAPFEGAAPRARDHAK